MFPLAVSVRDHLTCQIIPNDTQTNKADLLFMKADGEQPLLSLSICQKTGMLHASACRPPQRDKTISVRLPPLASVPVQVDIHFGRVMHSISLQGTRVLRLSARFLPRRHITHLTGAHMQTVRLNGLPLSSQGTDWHPSSQQEHRKTLRNKIGQSLHRAETSGDATETIALLRDGLPALSAEQTGGICLALAEPFCRINQFHALFDCWEAQGAPALALEDSAWSRSSALPFHLLNADPQAFIHTLSELKNDLSTHPDSWFNTASVFWCVNQILTDRTLRTQTQALYPEITRHFLALLEALAQSYWSRLHCRFLIQTLVILIKHAASKEEGLQPLIQAAQRHYGFSPGFWQSADAAQLPPEALQRLQPAKAACWDLQHNLSLPSPLVQTAGANKSTSETHRLRHETSGWQGGPLLGARGHMLLPLSPAEKIHSLSQQDIAVVSVMRNEMFMLPAFLAHYRACGVTAFLIADNGSDDGTRAYLEQQPDVALFEAPGDFRQAAQGSEWKLSLMAQLRLNRWSLVADSDELLVYPGWQEQSLQDYLSRPEFENTDAFGILMLDMYPKGTLSNVRFQTASPFEEATHVDRNTLRDEGTGRGPFSTGTGLTSGLRHRLMPHARPDMFTSEKVALLRYRPWMRLSVSLHYATHITRAEPVLVFGHFKYNAAFEAKARREASRGQYFNASEEYRAYLRLIQEGHDHLFDPTCSVPWQDSDPARALGL